MITVLEQSGRESEDLAPVNPADKLDNGGALQTDEGDLVFGAAWSQACAEVPLEPLPSLEQDEPVTAGEILADSVSSGDISTAERFVARFSYSASALRALAAAHSRDLEDPVGADILLSAARVMAEHEAAIV
jgi:hypothetical protein